MSLLLDALKKAELAKQAAKEPLSTDKPPFTRDKLPDISQPMEIRSEDLSLAEPAQTTRRAETTVLELAPEELLPRAEPAPAPRAAPAMREAPAETDYSPPSETVERKQAQQLFETKELDVNPRKPFYYTMGALGLFALGTVGYFWYELQPKNNFKIPPPSAQPAPQPVATAPATPAAPGESPAAATVTPPTGTQPAAQAAGASASGAAPTAAAPPAVRAPAPASVPSSPRGPVFARQGAAANGPAPAPQPGPGRTGRDVTITPASVQLDPLLERAYQAYNTGDLERARNDYQQALTANPDSRDALLGLAAVETQARRFDAADRYYTRLLELDPRDAHAQAWLIGLRGQLDPQAAESRLKNLIAAQPEANFLYFTLGNQYAAQGRWAEAQQAYFHAYTRDPGHADFAYNLAISLDRLHQSKPALEYYRRALALAENRPVSFDKAQVSARVSQLERGP